uniref:Uncharacterized protein n=1 Tax=Oryza glumipatula TaxID=40148 RepID=A0A0D9YY09_9ORYZ
MMRGGLWWRRRADDEAGVGAGKSIAFQPSNRTLGQVRQRGTRTRARAETERELRFLCEPSDCAGLASAGARLVVSRSSERSARWHVAFAGFRRSVTLSGGRSGASLLPGCVLALSYCFALFLA